MVILSNYSCGGLIPSEITQTIGKVYNVILIIVPILIVVFGLIDLVKAVISGKEDEIKKGTSVLIKRIVTGLIVFFIFSIVKITVSLINSNEAINSDNCLNEIFGN